MWIAWKNYRKELAILVFGPALSPLPYYQELDMPSKPMHRRTYNKRTREVASAETLAKLYDIGPYDRNQINLSQINRLRDLVDNKGLERAAEFVGVSDVTLLRVCAGFGHRLRPKTAEKIREFFGKK